MYIANNSYIYKPNYTTNKERNIYLELQQLKAELIDSPKKDLIFKANACLYILKILHLYNGFLKSLADGNIIFNYTTESLLNCLKWMIEKEYKTTSLSNTILQDVINTIYGDSILSVAKYTMIKEDWVDAVFKYITSDEKTSILTKDKMYPAIKNAPLLEIYIPKEVYNYDTTISYRDEVRILLSKLGVIGTLELIDMLYSKIFIFSIRG